MVGLMQLGIIIGSFNLPNSIINGATWYAPVIDFGRIALLFGVPVGDVFLSSKLLAIGKRKKEYLKQFVDASIHAKYDLIEPIYFINLTLEQIDLTEVAFKHSNNDLVLDPSLSFQLLQRYLKGTNKHV